MKAFLQMKLPPQSRRKGHAALLHWFAKDEKGYPFLSIGSCADKTEKGTLFLSILLSLKKIDKGVKFPLQTHLPMTLIMAILLVD